jgi:hypothetical protein
MSNVSEQLDLYIEQSLRKVKDHEALILKKRNKLSHLKTQEFLPSMRNETSGPQKSQLPTGKAYLLQELSRKVLVFGKFEIPGDFFEVDCSNQSENLINFLVTTGEAEATKYQVVFNGYFELSEIRNLSKGNTLDTKELWDLIKNIDDCMLETPDDLLYKKNFIGLLKNYYMGNLVDGRKVKRPPKRAPEKVYF